MEKKGEPRGNILHVLDRHWSNIAATARKNKYAYGTDGKTVN